MTHLQITTERRMAIETDAQWNQWKRREDEWQWNNEWQGERMALLSMDC